MVRKAYVVGGGVGGLVGYGVSRIGEAVAYARAETIPELARIDFIHAFTAGRSTDWAFYHYPEAMAAGLVLLGVGAGLFAIMYNDSLDT